MRVESVDVIIYAAVYQVISITENVTTPNRTRTVSHRTKVERVPRLEKRGGFVRETKCRHETIQEGSANKTFADRIESACPYIVPLCTASRTRSPSVSHCIPSPPSKLRKIPNVPTCQRKLISQIKKLRFPTIRLLVKGEEMPSDHSQVVMTYVVSLLRVFFFLFLFFLGRGVVEGLVVEPYA